MMAGDHFETASPDQAFVVRAGGLPWALPAQSVQTVFRIASITPVPLAPPVIEGLVNLRGRVVVAVNLARRLLGGTAHGAEAGTLSVAVERGAEVFALIVEDVGEVVSIRAADRIDLLPHVPAEIARMTSAWFRTRDGVVPLLDADRLLDLEVDRRSGVDRRIQPPIANGANPS